MSISKRLYLSPPDVGETERRSLLAAFDTNFIAPVGPHLEKFEEKFQSVSGFAHAVAVSSGTAAMHLALREVGVGPGDVVLASTLTFIGSVSPIGFLNAEAVFVDSDRETWNMCPKLLIRAIEALSKEKRRIGAIVPTDLYGQSCDLYEIRKIAENYNIPLVVDSAEALGSKYQGESVGKGADAAIFSFNGNKILTTSSGGILASDNPVIIERARYLATQARDPVVHFEHKEVGYNYRMSNLLAAIGVAQLCRLEERVAKKRQIFEWYTERLEGKAGLDFMKEAEYGIHNRWLTTLVIDPALFGCDNESLRLSLEGENVESRPVWKPMHLQPCFRGCRVFGGFVSEVLFKTGLCLPSGSQMDETDVERVCEIVLRGPR